MIKIKFVDIPVEKFPKCRGCYDSFFNVIKIKKGLPFLECIDVFCHEFIHMLIYFLIPSLKIRHYIHFCHEIFWVLIFTNIYEIPKSLKFYFKYYRDARKDGSYVG